MFLQNLLLWRRTTMFTGPWDRSAADLPCSKREPGGPFQLGSEMLAAFTSHSPKPMRLPRDKHAASTDHGAEGAQALGPRRRNGSLVGLQQQAWHLGGPGVWPQDPNLIKFIPRASHRPRLAQSSNRTFPTEAGRWDCGPQAQ